jgi:hypothetical protein
MRRHPTHQRHDPAIPKDSEVANSPAKVCPHREPEVPSIELPSATAGSVGGGFDPFEGVEGLGALIEDQPARLRMPFQPL